MEGEMMSCKPARLTLAGGLALTVAFALGTDVITKHRTEDKVFLGRQLIERTGDEHADGSETFLTAKVDIDVSLPAGCTT